MEPGSTVVLAAVISRADRFLVCKRPTYKRHGGLWEFPGGKLEGDETLEQAAQRELAEELGVLTLAVGEPAMSIHDVGSPFTICFVPVEISGEPKRIDHDDIRWLTTAELMDIPLAPSDRRFSEWLLMQGYERDD